MEQKEQVRFIMDWNTLSEVIYTKDEKELEKLRNLNSRKLELIINITSEEKNELENWDNYTLTLKKLRLKYSDEIINLIWEKENWKSENILKEAA